MVGLVLACRPEPSSSPELEFRALLDEVSRSWSVPDVEAALECFTDDAVYMQPPDGQLYHGVAELRLLLNGMKPGTSMEFHNQAYDAEAQLGFAEFTFATANSERASHGVVVIEVSEGRIASWREYFEPGPNSFERFIAIEGKDWEWTGERLLELAYPSNQQ